MHKPFWPVLPLILLLVSGAVSPARTLEFATIVTSPPESGAITNLVLKSGEGSFLCLPPHRWIPRLDSANALLTFTSPDHAAIRVGFGKVPSLAAGTAPVPEILRQELLRRSPTVKILGEGTCYTEAYNGVYLDSSWETGSGSLFCSRTAWVKVGQAWIEFELTTVPSRFGALSTVFQDFLTTFQTHTPRS